MSARTGSRRLLVFCMASGVTLTGLTVAAAAASTSGAPTGIPIIDSSATAAPAATTTASATPTATATATSSAGPSDPTATPQPTADADGLLTQPRKGCLQFPDVAGDAYPNPAASIAGDFDDDLDITGLAYRTSSTAFQVYVKETALGDGPSSFSGAFDSHSFSTGFTVGGKVIALSAAATGPATVTVGGVASTALHPTASFDKTHSVVIFSVPRTELVTLAGTALLGTPVTALTATSVDSNPIVGDSDADTAAPTTTAQKTYVFGDNTCFLPPAAKLFVSGLTATYTDTAKVTASIQDSDGADLSGEMLTLHIPGLPDRTLPSNASGDVLFTFKETLHSGTRPLTVFFAGSSAAGKANLSDTFTIKVESTQLKVAVAKGLITATLLDNDNAPIANRHVTFTVGTTRYNVTTDSRGKALRKGIAKGTAVKVSFAAVPTLYSAARTVSVTAL